MAVGDLSGDGRPDVVIADKGNAAVMVYRNTSSSAGAPCFNAAPIAKNDVATVIQNAPLTTINVLANDTDPDGGPKLVASVTQPAHGSAAIGGGGVRYKPATGYCNDLGPARDTFAYKLNGGSSATVAVTVECIDNPPPTVPGPGPPPPSPPPPPPPPPAPPRTCNLPGTTPFKVGTPGDDVLVGTNGRDVLSGRGGDDCLFGRPNDDRLAGGTGADLLDGGSGGDRIHGDAGKDKIRGGRGNDDITPGTGQDTVAAQGGDDEIFARDQTRDTIDCGAGRDKVKADRTDSVKNCEFVKRAARRARRR
jgi:Ca2+-binding RTX toxin-like protein